MPPGDRIPYPLPMKASIVYLCKPHRLVSHINQGQFSTINLLEGFVGKAGIVRCVRGFSRHLPPRHPTAHFPSLHSINWGRSPIFDPGGNLRSFWPSRMEQEEGERPRPPRLVLKVKAQEAVYTRGGAGRRRNTRGLRTRGNWSKHSSAELVRKW